MTRVHCMNLLCLVSNVLFFLIVMSGCTPRDSNDAIGEEACSSLECKKEEALLGDRQSSAWVVQRVSMDQKHYWLGISAQNGVPSSMYEYSVLLSTNSVREECFRALYWAKAAEERGVERAKKLKLLLEKQRGGKLGFRCGCAPYDLDIISSEKKCQLPESADVGRYDPSNRLTAQRVDN